MRRPGTQVSKGWWEHEVLDLEGVRVSTDAAAEENTEEAEVEAELVEVN